MIPDLLQDPIYRRVVYMDVDVLCVGSIQQLFDMEVNQSGIAAKRSLHNVVGQWCQQDPMLWYGAGTSVNAGILVMDVVTLRKNGFTSKTLNIAQTCPVNDQIAINMYLNGNETQLDANFNVFFGKDDHLVVDPRIIHFASSSKPCPGPCMTKIKIPKIALHDA